MDPADLVLRHLTYALFVELGRAPTPRDVAERGATSVEGVIAAWGRLHDQHAIVLDADGESLRMANPFSAVPTAFRVHAAERSWHANCAWDAFGILAALQVDGWFDATCPDCGEKLAVDVVGGRPDDESLLFHCLVPAAEWWEDIVFT